MRLIGKGFSSSTDETVPACATRFSWHSRVVIKRQGRTFWRPAIAGHRVSFDFNGSWISLGHLSGSYCILRRRKTSRPRPSAPSVPPLREAASSARDCTQPVDGTENPLRGNAERFSLQASPFIIHSLFPPQRQSHDDYVSVGKNIVESVARLWDWT